MPLMGSFYIGTSGLQTSQNALNTTAHNLSNVDTVGYTRQQVQQAAKFYNTIAVMPNSVANQQTGLGVEYARVKQVRDYFLDKTYRLEVGRSEFYQVSTEVMEEVESQLGELNGEAFQTTLTDLWTAIEELSKDPSSSVTQGLLVQRASEFVERATAVYTGLTSYQDNLNRQVAQQVNKINDYGNKILTLNDKIRSIESGGVEQANDLRDTRNKILDELAELADITVGEDVYGNVTVQIEGVDFVKGNNCYEIGLDVDETTGFYTPFWPQNASFIVNANGTRAYNIDGAEVFDLNREISADMGTDIGGLKAMLLARGDHRADYTDIKPENYAKVAPSVLMNIQGEFDQLVHNVISAINDILSEAAGVTKGNLTLQDGTVLEGVSYFPQDVGGYLRGETGVPLQLFTKITSDGYDKVTGADGKEYWVLREEIEGKQDTLYSIKNLEVNAELMQNPARLGFIKPDGSVDNDTMEALKKAFEEEKYTLNPNVRKNVDFVTYYTDLVSQIANSGSVYRSIYENQQNTVESTDSARQQILAVSSDEELSNMINCQNAFNASSRYINVISEMLQHLISTLGN
ncbi:MAG: flagellar hook-associated protein FlgK [Lachnospiraceae bacterium]|nr:flagellar hook-associated protein FlgK [Lachnospiraceae bacterium]